MMAKEHYTGLNSQEVIKSRNQYGSNILTPPEKESLFFKFLEKFKDPLIVILLVAGALSIGISIYEYTQHPDPKVFFEPVGIWVAIFLATGMAFYFEYAADKEFEVLNQVNDDEPVQVVRNGITTEVPRKDVVVGDIVILVTGCEVPADGELLEATSLNIDESSLTGEPICLKTTKEEDFDSNATFPSNHAMRGTKVMEGHGVMRVFAVGDHTENGKVFKAAQIDNSVKTPLNEQLDGLGDLIAKISYVIAGLIIVGRIGMYFVNNDGFSWFGDATNAGFITETLQACMVAVALVAVAVPEGLPMAVTLSLAYSMRAMLKTNNLVRKMHACETMGATTVICTDKTGTLTQNKMQVHETKFFNLQPDQTLNGSEASNLIVEGISVNSTALLDLTDAANPKVLGNPTEGALLLWLNKHNIDFETVKDAAERVDEIPFSTERKYMASLVKSQYLNGKKVLYLKGAPEIVLALCSNIAGGETKQTINETLLKYQNQAMRTLAFAYQILEDGEVVINSDNKLVANNLTFMGIVAIADPVREEVPGAVGNCIEAGIDIKIVTGDTTATAKEIGRQIGLWKETYGDNNIITGPEFAALTDDEVYNRVEEIKIIARARPLDKKRLVETLQKRNQVVAVTGDGTNDAPALKAAHVGLSMGDGTSVAKEASDITIIDNSFSSITRAVMWGRSLYQNIQRFILFQMTVNVAACLIVLVGAFIPGIKSPLTVTQMLWVNLIMDTFAAMALASLPPSMKVMKEAPRSRDAFIINKPMMKFILTVGVFFFVVMMGMLFVMKSHEITFESGILGMVAGGKTLPAYECSVFFTTFVMLQFWNMFNAKAFATGKSALHFKDCKGFLTIAALIFFGQLLIVNLGGAMFNVTPLNIIDWLLIVGATSAVLWIGEIMRMLNK
ncbi:MAG: calcium-translocating P-type ATPase, PMCA-type [Bacteroidales bacterium]|nr:calcium-translocating P-type ATPase, PMCA-type [Candidatus Scybalocola fimicaballi]